LINPEAAMGLHALVSGQLRVELIDRERKQPAVRDAARPLR